MENVPVHGVQMNLAQELAKADRAIQAVINADYDRLMIRNRLAWEYLKRSQAQRLRNDKREQRKWK